MKKTATTLAASLTVTLLLCACAYAQAGSEINPTIHLLTNQAGIESGIDKSQAKITFEAAQALVALEFPTLVRDPSFYCIIHVMRWKGIAADVKDKNTNAPAPVKMPAIDLQNWYTYNVNEKKNFEGVRIFGSKNVGFLYLHINARGEPNLSGNARATLDTLASIATKQQSGVKLDQAEQDTLSEGKFLRSAKGREGVLIDGGVSVKEYTEFNYTWEEKEKLPKLAADAGQLLGLLTAQGGPVEKKPRVDFTEQPILLYGSSSKALPLKYKTSDITVKMIQLIDMLAGDVDKNQISAQTYDNEGRARPYDNEGRARFDLSLGVPVTRVKELTFNASDNTVRSSKTDKQHLYAFMNIFIKKIDTKGLKVNTTPQFRLGLPITGTR